MTFPTFKGAGARSVLGGLVLASEGIVWGAFAYLTYSLLNAVSAWLILSGRV